jgi:hypothetical protein
MRREPRSRDGKGYIVVRTKADGRAALCNGGTGAVMIYPQRNLARDAASKVRQAGFEVEVIPVDWSMLERLPAPRPTEAKP